MTAVESASRRAALSLLPPTFRSAHLANADLAAELGYDEPFRRLWTLWLAMSEAGFRERRLRDAQILFAKPGRSLDLSTRAGATWVTG
jgi:hypothetical protein